MTKQRLKELLDRDPGDGRIFIAQEHPLGIGIFYLPISDDIYVASYSDIESGVNVGDVFLSLEGTTLDSAVAGETTDGTTERPQ